MKILLHSFFVWTMSVLHLGGYFGILLLMAMESSIFPVPSELVIPPAAYWASQGEMTFLGVLLAGTLGSWLGASITYWVSSKLGRPLVLRYGRYVLMPPEKLKLAEDWVLKYGREGIFFARLLPVMRHVISIPAGVVGMNFFTFSWTTLVGSALWCSILAWFGPRIITPEMFNDANSMIKAVKGQTHMIGLLMVMLVVLYTIMRYMANRRTDSVLYDEANPTKSP